MWTRFSLLRKHLFFTGERETEATGRDGVTKMREADAIRSIKGIGEKTEKLFGKLGIQSVGDLLRYYPRDYDEY